MADRHYSRQKPGAPQFVKPGSCLVLKHVNEAGDVDALWVTSAPIADYVQHEWAGAWECSLFRNESGLRASDLIRDAVAATLWRYGEPPVLGMVTFIDTDKTRPIAVPGYSYRRARFRHVGETKGGLLAFQLMPARMPEPEAPAGAQLALFGEGDER
jgi:hypothetical protein